MTCSCRLATWREELVLLVGTGYKGKEKQDEACVSFVNWEHTKTGRTRVKRFVLHSKVDSCNVSPC